MSETEEGLEEEEEGEEVWMNEQMSGDETERVQLSDWNETGRTWLVDVQTFHILKPLRLSSRRNLVPSGKIYLLDTKITAHSHPYHQHVLT